MTTKVLFNNYLSLVNDINQHEKDYTEVLEELHAAAINSSTYNLEETTSFYFNLGNTFLLKQDFNEALIWYKYAVENGHALSAKLISSIYKEDNINMLKWLNQAYLLGYKSKEAVLDVYDLSSSVIAELNLINESFISPYKELIAKYIVERDSLKDIKDYFFLKYKPKISLSDVDKYALADYLLINEKLEEALYWYKELAESGNIDAMHDTGVVYDMLGKEEKEIIYWYKKAAVLGNIKAQNDLHSVLKDAGRISESLYWLKKAAENNEFLALYNLGNKYHNGDNELGINKDMNKAIEYYTKSANAGYIKAEYKLGLVYETTKDNYKTSTYWYERVVKNTIPLTKYPSSKRTTENYIELAKERLEYIKGFLKS